jgi:hypothetical protein
VAVLSVARTARLLTYDDFPPIAWLRARALSWLAKSKRRMRWVALTECPFCVAPYLAAGMAAWAWASGLDAWWWWINGTWAAAYVAAIVNAYDQRAEA